MLCGWCGVHGVMGDASAVAMLVEGCPEAVTLMLYGAGRLVPRFVERALGMPGDTTVYRVERRAGDAE
jgi:hypothetical protein